MIPLRILVLMLCLSCLPAFAFAHGGEKHDDHETTIEEQPAVGSPVKLIEDLPMDSHAGHSTEPVEYGMGSGNAVDYGTGSGMPGKEQSASPSLGLEDDPLGLGAGSMDSSMQGEMMDLSGHDMADMKDKQHIEQATHEMVASSSKGYGLAVGITVLSGLVAGILFLKRPTDS
ncbi:exported hypothetical protein [Nitrospina gracilis 3/211]|uniref:Uncharacterized protein n=1 Tax=Nitrospina gracilis (strain 3/211) TaxID=1266370 RepID=M1ZCI1_NITG3|nr:MULTISPECIES: hypothetical protein [Nitrospina]MCF8723938.1 hypothetical protein [Nitrospina sp. Nb-3]CCQ91061.1 exported hypothetical protein [Nitrospina gracilis 3/211]